MNVFHINCNYLTTVLHQTMIEHLNKTGVTSFVFAPTYDASKAVITPNKNVCVSQCFKKWDRVSYFYKQNKIIHSANTEILKDKYDIIHAYTLFTDGNVARTLSKRHGIPYVVAIRDTDVNDFFKYRPHLIGLGVRIMLDASKVFFLSESYRKRVIEEFVPKKYKNTIEKKSLVVPNGIDDFWINNTHHGNKTLNSIQSLKIVYAGRINKRKNIPLTLKVVDLLKSEGYNISFTVVGKIDDNSEFEKIRKLGSFEYIEAQPKEKLIDIYRNNDIFVMPSHTETFGLVYAEAMTQGLPVVYTKEQGFDGQFNEGEVGYAVSDKDPENVKKAIISICERYREISTNCSKLSMKFEWSKICEEYCKIYNSI